MNSALSQYWAIGIVGLVALYTGAKWMGHLKNAVRTQWRPGFDLRPQQINIVIRTVVNLALLLGFLLGMTVTFGLASLSTSFANTVVNWLGFGDQPWIAPVLRVSSVAVAIGAGWLIFMYLYTVLPETREPWSTVRRGALLGSIGLAGLQYVATFLITAFKGNPAAAIFGPAIVLMLFFNIFAQLTLFIAAWIATAQHDAVPLPAEEDGHTSPEPEPQREQPEFRSRMWFPRPWLSARVRAGMGAGYVTGAATGVGLRRGARVRVLSRCARPEEDLTKLLSAHSVRGGELRAGLADAVQQRGEPWCAEVERLAAFDPVELDGPQLVIALLIVSDQPRLTAQRTLDRQVGHGLDQCEVTLVGGGPTMRSIRTSAPSPSAHPAARRICCRTRHPD